jgi:hypothetical protein
LLIGKGFLKSKKMEERMSDPTRVGETKAVNKHTSTMKQPQSTPDTTPTRLNRRPPVVRPQEHPAMIMRRLFASPVLEDSPDYKLMVAHIAAYKRGGDVRRWDDYRQKIPADTLKLFGDILTECRRNGFIHPVVIDDKIVFQQITAHMPSETDLCTLCSKYCRIRENIDDGTNKRERVRNKNYEEPKKCWEATV